jgi:membrane protease YdiL (CAAX protease family)
MKPLLQLTPVFILWLYVFKEKGLPFRLTRKHLFSSIIFGCIFGLLYYFVASGVFIGVMQASGQGADFHFVAGWDDAGWWLIIAMMFSYMIGTGPTEELFSRGFLQDQTARAFSLKFAILFTAVLFAAGHLPISILVYRLSFMTIVWYMIILVIMGCFFSILYQHGLWDWYLSLYAIRGAYSKEFLADYSVNFGMMDFISTILTLSIMLPIFYIVYLVWWKHDKPLEEGPLANIVRSVERFRITERIRFYDKGWWPRNNPIIIIAAIVGLFCLASIPLAAAIGTDDKAKFEDRMMGGESTEMTIVYLNGSGEYSDTLIEGQDNNYPLEFNETYIESITLNLNWQDEVPRTGYTNEPDVFSIVLLDPNGVELGSETGNDGNLELIWEDKKELKYNVDRIARCRR